MSVRSLGHKTERTLNLLQGGCYHPPAGLLDDNIQRERGRGLSEEYPELKEFPLNVEGEEDLFGKK